MAPEEILSSTIALCPFGVIVLEPRGTVVLANGVTERMFGYAASTLLGTPIKHLVPSMPRALDRDRCGHVSSHSALEPADETDGDMSGHAPDFAAVRKPENHRFSGRRKDGGKFPLEIRLNPISLAGRELVLGVVVDISEKVAFERFQDGFLATVRHELRTPLTSIAGALGLLATAPDATLPAATLRLISIAQANSQTLLRLVSGILDMDKLESGAVVFVAKRVAARATVELAIEANRAFAEASGVRVTLAPGSSDEELRGDPDWLFKAVSILLSNAIKFSPRGAEVTMTIETSGENARICVRDRGPGVPDEFKGRLFEKFAQADTSDTRAKGGAGLGLSIVKQAVTRLGGDVGYVDAPGGGAIFYVELPRREGGGGRPANSRHGGDEIVRAQMRR
jgi:signal transduction histidine kinase